MRVLMVAPQPFFEPRGTPISVHQRLLALSRLGHEVDLLTYHIGRDVDIPSVQIYRIPHIPFVKKVKIGPSWSKLFLDVFLFLKAVQMLFVREYDLIHSHEEAGFFCFLLARVFRIQHLYDMHSSLPRQLEQSKYGKLRPAIWAFQQLETWLVRHCDAVITIGKDLEEDVQRINPRVDRIVIENLALHDRSSGTDEFTKQLELTYKNNGHIPIVYTGSFEPYQGLDMLLESALLVREKVPQAVFLLVGGNVDQIEHYQEQVRQYGLEQNVQFCGSVSPEKAMAFLEIAALLVSPRIEGMSIPLKIYSYLLSGKPCVATRMPAHTQVLNDEIAWLVEPTKEAFAEGILRALEEQERSSRMGKQAQRYAREKYNFHDYVAKVHRIYQAIKPDGEAAERALPLAEE